MEIHLPGTNYMGPGTHVIQRLLSGVPPTSLADAVALRHDFTYLFAKDGGDVADLHAIRDSGFAPDGIIMKVGLLGRLALGKILGFDLTGRVDSLPIDNATLYRMLRPMVLDQIEPFGIKL